MFKSFVDERVTHVEVFFISLSLVAPSQFGILLVFRLTAGLFRMRGHAENEENVDEPPYVRRLQLPLPILAMTRQRDVACVVLRFLICTVLRAAFSGLNANKRKSGLLTKEGHHIKSWNQRHANRLHFRLSFLFFSFHLFRSYPFFFFTSSAFFFFSFQSGFFF